MKIAVIGAGIFGITSALKLTLQGFDVTLFDQNRMILSGASYCNQYRLHKGYHYPRSTEMIQNPKSFEEFYQDAICDKGFDRYYAISNKGSKTNKEEYLTFLENNKLKYEIVDRIDIIKNHKVDLIVKVQESSFDIDALSLSCVRKLKASGIRIKLGCQFDKKMMHEFDIVVNCTYSNLNCLLDENDQVDYQFELVEKPIASLGTEYQRKSAVIMDGEFCCIDPFGDDGCFHVFGHVKEAIHETQTGKVFNVPDQYRDVINSGIVNDFKHSKFKNILEGVQDFFNFNSPPVINKNRFGNVGYYGSMFTIRTVLPNRDHDDARPSYITKHSDKLYSVFSGKIGTSVDIANELTKMIKK